LAHSRRTEDSVLAVPPQVARPDARRRSQRGEHGATRFINVDRRAWYRIADVRKPGVGAVQLDRLSRLLVDRGDRMTVELNVKVVTIRRIGEPKRVSVKRE